MQRLYLYNAAETYQKGLQSFGMHAPQQLASHPHKHTHTHTKKDLSIFTQYFVINKKKSGHINILHKLLYEPGKKLPEEKEDPKTMDYTQHSNQMYFNFKPRKVRSVLSYIQQKVGDQSNV